MSANLQRFQQQGRVDPWHPDFNFKHHLPAVHSAVSGPVGPTMARPHTAVVPYRHTAADGGVVNRPTTTMGYEPGTLKERPFVPANIASYAKFSPSDWVRHNLRHYASAEATRNMSEKLRSDAVYLLR